MLNSETIPKQEIDISLENINQIVIMHKCLHIRLWYNANNTETFDLEEVNISVNTYLGDKERGASRVFYHC